MANAKLSPGRPLGQDELPAGIRDLIEAKVAFCPTTGCWLWLGAIDHHGYGTIDLGTRGVNRRVFRAPRAAYVAYRGPVAGPECVCHRCDTPLCVNPDHLFLGSKADNGADMKRKGRSRNNPARGEAHYKARLTIENVRHIRMREMSLNRYAKLYGVTKTHVSAIQHGKTWRGMD